MHFARLYLHCQIRKIQMAYHQLGEVDWVLPVLLLDNDVSFDLTLLAFRGGGTNNEFE